MSRPNFLIFMTDQQHGGSILPGHRLKAITPALDRFSGESVTFSNAYCPSPHCCPSRASFYTGRYPSQHGVWHNVNVTNAISRGLRPDVRPWSCDLAGAGYRMVHCGKWHVSNYQHPDQYGWEVVYPSDGYPDMPNDDAKQLDLARNRELKLRLDVEPSHPADQRRPGEIIRQGYPPYIHYGTNENPFRDNDVVEAGINALHDLADETGPWCFYVGTMGPHDPYTPPQRFLDLYDLDAPPPLPDTFDDPMDDKPALYRRTRERFDQLSEEEHRQAIRHYLAFCSYADWQFSRLLDALDQTGQAENTVVLYLSDHGDYAGEHGLWCKGLPAFDSAYHIPAMIRMPSDTAGARGRRVDQLISLTDFGPTLIDLAGTEAQDDMSGRSLVPWLVGETPTGWPDDVFFQTNGNEIYGIQRSVMTSQWRFTFNSFDYDELYNLQDDPGQMTNHARDPAYRNVVRDMHQRLWRLMNQHEDTYLSGYIMTALMDYGPAAFPEP